MASAQNRCSAEVITGLTHAEYARIKAEHSGALRQLLVSPLAYRAYTQRGIDETDSMRLGRAVHTAVLEPHRFMEQYVCWTGGRRSGNAWNQYVADAKANGRTTLKEDQLDYAVAISKAVRAHPLLGALFAEKGRAELTIIWTHPRTGIKIKVRLDWLTETVVADLKTCRDPTPARFATASASLGYHFQLSLYADAVAAADLGPREVKIAAVANKEPFDGAIYRLPEELLSVGREQYEMALDRLIECRKAKAWPGFAESEELTLRLPYWAQADDGDDINFGEELIS